MFFYFKNQHEAAPRAFFTPICVAPFQHQVPWHTRPILGVISAQRRAFPGLFGLFLCPQVRAVLPRKHNRPRVSNVGTRWVQEREEDLEWWLCSVLASALTVPAAGSPPSAKVSGPPEQVFASRVKFVHAGQTGETVKARWST